MADIFETVIGMAEPALKMVGGLVGEVQASIQKLVNNAVAEAMKAQGASGGGSGAAAADASGSSPAPAAGRVRPLRAPGR